MFDKVKQELFKIPNNQSVWVIADRTGTTPQDVVDVVGRLNKLFRYSGPAFCRIDRINTKPHKRGREDLSDEL